MPQIKTVYIAHPIEFSHKSEPDWVSGLKKILEDECGIKCITPVAASYKEGGDIMKNQTLFRQLKREWRLEEFKAFMAKIWAINKRSVDECDAIITLARTPEELKMLSSSGGLFREINLTLNQGKPRFLICECTSLEAANSYFLNSILENGGMVFRNTSELIKYLKLKKRLPEVIYFIF